MELSQMSKISELLAYKLNEILKEFKDDMLEGNVIESFSDLIERRKNNILCEMDNTLAEYKKKLYSDKQRLLNSFNCDVKNIPLDTLSVMNKYEARNFIIKVVSNVHKSATYDGEDKTFSYDLEPMKARYDNVYEIGSNVFKQKNEKYNIVQHRIEQIDEISRRNTKCKLLKWLSVLLILSFSYYYYQLNFISSYPVEFITLVFGTMMATLMYRSYCEIKARKSMTKAKAKANKYIGILGKDLDKYVGILKY